MLGPAEEFGQTAPVGYAEAAPGDPFLKIGVGLLERPDMHAYEFWRPYRIVRPGEWQVTHGVDWAEMTQRLTLGGWSLGYAKRVTLLPDRPEIVLSHTLENTGTRHLETDWYCHNFVNIDGIPVGPEYHLTLPFPPNFQAQAGRAVTTSGQTMTFSERLGSADAQFGHISGFGRGETQHCITVENTASGAGVLLFGDRALSELRLFAAAGAVCPEPFLRLRIPPGQTDQWQTHYRLFAKTSPAFFEEQNGQRSHGPD